MLTKKILLLNWRDPSSPLEGGAERFTLEYARDWVERGYEVTWLTNTFIGCKKIEVSHGIRFIRVGPVLDGSLLKYFFFYPVFLLQSIYLASRIIIKDKVDIVIDEIHGFPFFTPLFSKARNILLVCEVAGTIWDKMFPFPVNYIGKFVEKSVYRLYRNTEIIAISENTKQNILHLDETLSVKVIDLGVSLDNAVLQLATHTKKFSDPTAIFLARLVKMKGIESAIEAAAHISAQLPKFKLLIVGGGEKSYVEYLKKRISELALQKNVNLVGFVDGQEKYKLLAQAHFLLHPSYKEGFGLTVIEAGLVGTPAIIRKGSSLDALVSDGHNGYHFTDDSEIAETFIKNWNSSQYPEVRKQSIAKAEKYLWKDVLQRAQKTFGI